MKRILCISALLCTPLNMLTNDKATNAKATNTLLCPCTQTSGSCRCASPDHTCSSQECRCVEIYGSCNCAHKAKQSKNISAEVSYGELIDKITILELKLERMTDPAKLKNVQKELDSLTQTLQSLMSLYPDATKEITQLKNELHKVNGILWNIEDDIRAKEAVQVFDDAFITLARNVYFYNDKRGEVKRSINIRLGSNLVEEKSYTTY